MFSGVGTKATVSRIFRVADVDDGKAAAEDMADIGMAAMDHDLYAVAAAALVAVPEEPDVTLVAACIGLFGRRCGMRGKRLRRVIEDRRSLLERLGARLDAEESRAPRARSPRTPKTLS